jgi:hypothetical protein
LVPVALLVDPPPDAVLLDDEPEAAAGEPVVRFVVRRSPPAVAEGVGAADARVRSVGGGAPGVEVSGPAVAVAAGAMAAAEAGVPSAPQPAREPTIRARPTRATAADPGRRLPRREGEGVMDSLRSM